MGGKPKEASVEDIYPQLSYSKNKKQKEGNNLVNWETTPERLRKEFIEAGLFDEDGNPRGYNPHA